MSVNTLILGDNLEILKTIESETVDLIYLDPPFFSNRNYEVIWGDEGEVRSFQDRWSGGMEHYIAWLKERVEQMYRILKPTGSIFLHCDWHADAYIRVGILDKIFGIENFREHVIWKRHNSKQKGSQFASKKFGSQTDSIFIYAKTEDAKIYTTRDVKDDEVEIKFPLSDQNGRRYYDDSAHLFCSPNMGARPNLCYEWRGYKNPHPSGWRLSKERLEEEYQKGNIVIREDGKLERRKYQEEYNGIPLGNLWDDISNVTVGKERIGCPTQKPEALLERIIKCATSEGDTVFDPFVGGGTTVAVADKLNRKWIGIDQSVQAIKVTELRLDKQRDLFSAPFSVQLHKYDYDTLRNKNAFEFEAWIVQQFGGVSNAKQRGDLGLDGKMPDNTPIQVKRSDNIGHNVIDNFLAAVMRNDKKLFDKNVTDKKPIGYIIAFSFGKGTVQEVARLNLEENIIIKLVTVEDIVPIAQKPTVSVEINEMARDAKGIREIEFVAAGTSEAGIEFYSWDFEYNVEHGFKADVMLDKEGKQTSKLKAGLHVIAVKVVDNDGLESIEVIKLKVNGTVERTM
ncbi:MAG: site-specific DNA-methyltransferase [Prevotellaceae bacterium]|jgi:DNA modification methylase|nr:site-specific DNA-methyltransferase [Prevotellaceae bacterium]